MDGVVRQVEEEGAVLVLLDELLGLDGQPVAEILAFAAALPQPGHGVALALVRPEIRGRMAVMRSGDVEVETLMLGVIVPAAEVPLADAGRDIAGRLERLGDVHFVQGQILPPRRHEQPMGGRVAFAGDPIGQMQSRGPLAGEDAGPRRRADRAGGVGVGEPHPLPGQAVDVRRLVELAAVAAHVGPAQVVGKDEDDIRYTGFGLAEPYACRAG